MTILSPNECLNLKQMIKDNDVQDFTNNIRAKCHSKLIKNDIIQYLEISNKYSRLEKVTINNLKLFVEISAIFYIIITLIYSIV